VTRDFLSLNLAVWIVGMLIASPDLSCADEAPTWQYGLSLSYLTGDYGEGEDTEIFYTAATLKRYFEKGDLTLTIPYLDISDVCFGIADYGFIRVMLNVRRKGCPLRGEADSKNLAIISDACNRSCV